MLVYVKTVRQLVLRLVMEPGVTATDHSNIAHHRDRVLSFVRIITRRHTHICEFKANSLFSHLFTIFYHSTVPKTMDHKMRTVLSKTLVELYRCLW